ncbi:MAG: hypothetical protein ACRBCT_01875 [Alphaproteobacteria bacterium]
MTKRASNSQNGSALVYILIAIALLAALTVSFMEPSSQQTSSQNTFKTATDLQGQVDTIRSAIQECLLLYPQGDSTIDTSGSGSDPDANTQFPINPNSTHFSAATPAQSGDRNVSGIRCPGNPDGAAVNHTKLFGGSTGKFMPPTPDLFEPWQYYNGTDGVYFWIESSKSDAFILSALERLDEQFDECEADVIDASLSAIDLDSATTALTQCPSGSVCFRVRMVINEPDAEYNGDTDGDEAGCI